jgi:hypothetical protein
LWPRSSRSDPRLGGAHDELALAVGIRSLVLVR